MPKSYGNLFEKVASYEELYNAMTNLFKSRGYKKPVMDAFKNYDAVVYKIRLEVVNQTFEIRSVFRFQIADGRKLREICAIGLRDSILLSCLFNVIMPIFDRGFIYDCYGGRLGKGPLKACDRLQEMMRKVKQKYDNPCLLKLDIEKCFPSLNRALLKEKLGKTLREQPLVDLCGRVMYGPDDKFNKVGILIGCPVSGLFLNVYLNEFDHWVKETLKARYYLRYADDMIFVCKDENEAIELYKKCRRYLKANLQLSFSKEKCRIVSFKQGVDFLGYHHWATHRIPRRKAVTKNKAKFREMFKKYDQGKVTLKGLTKAYQGLIGYFEHCTCGKEMNELDQFILTEATKYGFNIKPEESANDVD